MSVVDDLNLYLDAVIGDTEGYLHTFTGVGGYFTDTGRYKFARDISRHYRWPDQRRQAVADLLAAAEESDAYACPYLMVADKRHQGAAVNRRIVHADIDGGLFDAEKADTIGAFAVGSGSPGNAHAYVALSESVPAHWHRELCRGLGAYLGAKDAKIADNDVLRPPGTWNHKGRARGGKSTPAEWLIRPDGTVWEPHDLAAMLNVTLPEAEGTVSTASRPPAPEAADVEEVDLDAHPTVAAALSKNSGDRSADTMRVVGACHDAGFTLPQTRYVVGTRADLAGRLAERNDDDVAVCWNKAEQSRAAQVVDVATPTDIDGTDKDPAVFDFIDGGRFIFDQPDTIPAIWGRDSAVFWAEGESLMIAGPPGLGKTTLAGQLVRARLGLGDGYVLGLPVADTGGVILYLAMDRPRQIARSLARQFRGDDERQVCADRLTVWQGPPPADIAQNPGLLLKLAQEAGADTVVVDSVKDAATGLSDDKVGAEYNRARQMLVAAGIEVLELHHTVKRGANGGAPTAAADIYGSAWIVNGTGSVILLSGEPGDAVIGFRHIRQPAEEVGPWQVHHDQIAGRIRISESLDVVGFVADCGPDGATADDLVEVQHPGKNWENSRERNNAREKARRLLEKLVAAGKLQRADGTKGGVSGGSATVYFLAAVDDGGDVSDDGESDHAAITLFGKPQVKRSRAEPITETVTHRSRGSRDYEKPQVKRSRERSRGKSEAAITQPTVPLGTGVREPGGHQNGKPHPDTAATPSPAPADDAANDAYVNGLCRDCRAVPYSPGRTRCDSCHQTYQRVMAGYDR